MRYVKHDILLRILVDKDLEKYVSRNEREKL